MGLKLDDIYTPLWVSNDLADAAYTLEGGKGASGAGCRSVTASPASLASQFPQVHRKHQGWRDTCGSWLASESGLERFATGMGLKLDDIYTPLWVSNDLADATYTLEGGKVRVVQDADL